MRRKHHLQAVAMAALLSAAPALTHAQFIGQSFRNASDANWSLLNAAAFTAPSIDPAGDGWLRLTPNALSVTGQALFTGSFPSSDGIVADFDYVVWGQGGAIAADGFDFFLYNPAVPNAMQNGLYGGGLGYCRGAGGVLGLGFDAAYGAHATAGPCGDGDASQQPNRITLRGPVGSATTDTGLDGNIRIGSSVTPGGGSLLYNPGAVTRPTVTRSARVTLYPLISGGYQVMVDDGVTGSTLQRIIDSPFTYAVPSPLSLGFSASTGGGSEVHEVRLNRVVKPTDVAIAITGGLAASYSLGSAVRYTVTLTNKALGSGALMVPLAAADAPAITDTLSAQLAGVTWTCAASGTGTTCPAASGAGAITNLGGYALGEDGELTFTINGTIPAQPALCATTLDDSASASFAATSAYTDINPADNNGAARIGVTCAAAPANPVPGLPPGMVAMLGGLLAAAGAAKAKARRRHPAR